MYLYYNILFPDIHINIINFNLFFFILNLVSFHDIFPSEFCVLCSFLSSLRLTPVSVVITPVSYSVGFGIKSRPICWLFLIEIFIVFFSSPQTNAGLAPEIRIRPIPSTFFSFHCSQIILSSIIS